MFEDAANAPFGITTEDIKHYISEQKETGIHNSPYRDTKTTTFFGALMSAKAAFEETLTDEVLDPLRPRSK